ncbi:hypothetical protein TNCV_270531 [Trichonephila clavipes]|nr:hypothetical protein TNCV_270531 [Trichonephila clavipes]
MANFSGCPKFPKPRKGTQVNNKTYTNTVNSIVRPEISYSQAASTSNSKNTQQMAPHNNFTDNVRPENFNTNIDSFVTSTLENFYSNPPSIPITPTDPNEIINYANTNFINSNPFGFTRRLSTCHPLPRLTEKTTSGFQTNRSTGAVFLDIQKEIQSQLTHLPRPITRQPFQDGLLHHFDFVSFEFTPSRSEVVFLKLSGIGNSAFLLAAAFAYLFARILAPDSVENRVSFWAHFFCLPATAQLVHAG